MPDFTVRNSDERRCLYDSVSLVLKLSGLENMSAEEWVDQNIFEEKMGIKSKAIDQKKKCLLKLRRLFSRTEDSSFSVELSDFELEGILISLQLFLDEIEETKSSVTKPSRAAALEYLFYTAKILQNRIVALIRNGSDILEAIEDTKDKVVVTTKRSQRTACILLINTVFDTLPSLSNLADIFDERVLYDLSAFRHECHIADIFDDDYDIEIPVCIAKNVFAMIVRFVEDLRNYQYSDAELVPELKELISVFERLFNSSGDKLKVWSQTIKERYQE